MRDVGVLKSQVGLLQTAHSWANAVLLSIIIVIARGIQKATGIGHLHELGRGWSKSLMERTGFVMRTATKKDNTLPPNL